jgi:hypothetical protein
MRSIAKYPAATKKTGTELHNPKSPANAAISGHKKTYGEEIPPVS